MKRQTITLALSIITVGFFASSHQLLAEGDQSQFMVTSGSDSGRGEKKSVWTDVNSGFALAKKERKPIIVDVYTDWCGWCKRMERTTFRDPDLLKLMTSNFVLVRANAEDHGPGERLGRKYNVSGYPTVMLFDADGQAKATLIGYQEVAPFSAKLSDFLAGKPLASEQ